MMSKKKIFLKKVKGRQHSQSQLDHEHNGF